MNREFFIIDGQLIDPGKIVSVSEVIFEQYFFINLLGPHQIKVERGDFGLKESKRKKYVDAINKMRNEVITRWGGKSDYEDISVHCTDLNDFK